MLLAVDIGNTNISLGVFQGNNLVKRLNLATSHYQAKALRKIISQFRIKEAVISSVVPRMSEFLNRDIQRWLDRPAYNIGKEMAVPVKNLYRKPSQVGQDRLVNAYAGIRLYGSPLIVVDFGTALTFDVVSAKKEYLGGMILPGLSISLDALAKKTALLPQVKLKAPPEFIGKDTRSSILSGIVFGFAALTDDLVQRIREKIGRQAKVIATGGNINLLAKYCRRIDYCDPDLTLKGIYLVYTSTAPKPRPSGRG